MKRPKTAQGYVVFAIAWTVGVVGAIAFNILFLSFTLTVMVVHKGSFGLCRLGAHRAGCWIRRVVSAPALLEIKHLTEKIEALRRKNGPAKT